MNREQMPGAKEVAELLESLKKENIRAIFPERESNPKILESLTRDSGIKLGGELIADGRGTTSYEEMMRANVNAIVSALTSK
jgi:ABC-type Zn uptake system ZnuABC Zn-binding protein ZnuA